MPPKIGIVKGYKFENYKKAIETHGGAVEELLIDDEQAVNRYIDQIHGLLLPGGGDIDPDLFGEERHCETKNVNRAKDEFEMSLFRKAIEKDMPVFGICRGIQIMNVERGGSLYQHIPEQIGDHLTYEIPEKSDDLWHSIQIQPSGQLCQITHKGNTEVTSSHHQAVKVIGKGLVVTAQSKDGIIEAMEYPSKSNQFAIGVQYHPERMWIDKKPPLHDRKFYAHAERLFEAFINAATTYRAHHK
ncbi:MAG: gamma-glutamyl-gamma-aminobutyrate hydrolase family protein [Candidatus Poribacteria bacterium]|nr:gamma-glutamyl-gamma-aminobutyrate hydrolase family protein [Candidatus Poribacteria bacterium]